MVDHARKNSAEYWTYPLFCLRPLLGFRNWLSNIRDNPRYRCRRRRNGATGPGPFTLEARRRIRDCLLVAQKASGIELITEQELELIRELWEADRSDRRYRDIERGGVGD